MAESELEGSTRALTSNIIGPCKVTLKDNWQAGRRRPTVEVAGKDAQEAAQFSNVFCIALQTSLTWPSAEEWNAGRMPRHEPAICMGALGGLTHKAVRGENSMVQGSCPLGYNKDIT